MVRGEKLLEKFAGEKREIINKKGTFIVKAGPGSGKTLAVAVKLSLELKEWQYSTRGIAAISFTNVAWQEIEEKLRSEFEVANGLAYPHYIGTIDSFINRFILLPFGHLVMECSSRPEIIMNYEPNAMGNAECFKSQCRLKDISYDVYGNLICHNDRSHFKNCSQDHRYCSKVKENLHKKGYITQTDGNYFALRILEEYPSVSKSIAYRFPMVIVDEAQDTSEIQMRILELLLDNGVERLTLIGDPNQAIFEWRTANPDVFLEKTSKWDTLPLKENWRSSQRICRFTDRLLDGTCKSVAMNEDVRDFGFEPQLWGYDKDQPLNYEIGKLIDRFLSVCLDSEIGLSKDNIAILVRGKNIINEIISGNSQKDYSPWRERYIINKKTFRDKYKIHYANVAKSKYLFDTGEFYDAFKLFERTIAAIILGEEYINLNRIKECYVNIGLSEWRKQIFRVFINLPETNIDLGDWVTLANRVLSEFDKSLNLKGFQMKIKRSSKENDYKKLRFEDIFGSKKGDDRYTLGTVHSVKGRTFEAVLLILKEKSAKGKYSSMIDINLAKEEEMRVVYVAITRPRRILVIATPYTDLKMWENKFQVQKQKSIFDF
ncbi:MAG: DNA-dependent helicase II [Methanosaeta sp. PtaU1.Bin060]|nr:MAG: DNA-dependent helicase II [Methanosaeta sp. PtaU1.Bin060]